MNLEGIVARDRKEALNSYVTDMLALEDHIEKAIRSQLTDLKDYPDVVTELRQIHRTIEHRISDLRGLGDRGGRRVVETVKRADRRWRASRPASSIWCGPGLPECGTTTPRSAWPRSAT
jgi:hypothetical protein